MSEWESYAIYIYNDSYISTRITVTLVNHCEICHKPWTEIMDTNWSYDKFHLIMFGLDTLAETIVQLRAAKEQPKERSAHKS